MFVSKLDPTGTNLVYSTYIGGTGYDDGRAIAVDAAGNAYVTGLTGSTDFPTTLGAYQTTFGGGNYDVFMSKLNAVATSLDYSTYLGGTGNDQGHSIAIDGSGNACVAGETYSTNFPVTAGAFQTTPGGNGDADAFAARLNSTGTTLLYSTYLGGALYDAAFGVVVDNSGNTLVTGWTDTRNPGGFPTTPDAFHNTSGSFGYHAFLTKLNQTGMGLFSSLIGGNRTDFGFGISVDASSAAYLTGYTDSTDFASFSPNAYQPSFGGGTYDAYVAKITGLPSALPTPTPTPTATVTPSATATPTATASPTPGRPARIKRSEGCSPPVS